MHVDINTRHARDASARTIVEPGAIEPSAIEPSEIERRYLEGSAD